MSEEALAREVDSILTRATERGLIDDFEHAEWFLIEMRDPTNGNVVRTGFWARDEHDDAVAEAFRMEAELNADLGDQPPFECVVQPVFDRERS